MNNILTIIFHSSFWEEMTVNKFLGIMLIIFLYLVFLVIAALIIQFINKKYWEKTKVEQSARHKIWVENNKEHISLY